VESGPFPGWTHDVALHYSGAKSARVGRRLPDVPGRRAHVEPGRVSSCGIDRTGSRKADQGNFLMSHIGGIGLARDASRDAIRSIHSHRKP
jgi:hypothetical protein